MVYHQDANPVLEGLRCRLAKLQAKSAQRASQTQLDVMKLALQQFASAQQGPGFLRRHRFAGHRTEPAYADQLRDAARVLAVSLYRHQLESIAHVSGFQQFDRQTRLLHAGKQPLRKWAGFQPDPRNIKAKVSTPRSQSFRFAGYLGLANDPPGCVHHADARAFQRYINSGIVLHGRPFDDAWSRAIPDSVQSHHHSEGRPLPTPLPVGRPVTPSREIDLVI